MGFLKTCGLLRPKYDSFLQPSKISSSVFSHNSTKGDKLPFSTYCILQSFFLCPSLKFHTTLEISSENILFSPIFILSFHLIDTISFHNNYIITNNSMSFPCGSPVAVNVRFSSFLATSTFHPHFYQHDEATASNEGKKGKHGRRKKDELEL